MVEHERDKVGVGDESFRQFTDFDVRGLTERYVDSKEEMERIVVHFGFAIRTEIVFVTVNTFETNS